MSQQWNRRDVLKGLAAASTAMMISPAEMVAQGEQKPLAAPVEIRVTSLSAYTFRLSILPLNKGSAASIPFDGSLIQESWGAPTAKLRIESSDTIIVGNFRLKISCRPASIRVANQHGDLIQQFDWDPSTGVLSFLIGNSPLFGLGEGGPQFDRRGSTDTMRSGQGGYKLGTHGGCGDAMLAMLINLRFVFSFSGTHLTGAGLCNDLGLAESSSE